MGALARDRSPAIQITSISFREDGRLDNNILRECDVAKIVTDAFQRDAKKPRRSTKIDVALRIDRVAKLGGRPPPGSAVGGTELAVSVISAAGQEMNQPFACRKDAVMSSANSAHCARLEDCSGRIASQISTWLAWRLRQGAGT
jgi:hypothetical protein